LGGRRGGGRDKGAAVKGSLGDDERGGLMPGPIAAAAIAARVVEDELLDDGEDEGELADSPLQPLVEAADNRGIEADARHHDELAAGAVRGDDLARPDRPRLRGRE